MASKRRIRRKACDGKVAYRTPEVAYNTMYSVIRSGRKNGYLHVYKCEFGSHYHIGHAGGKPRWHNP